MKDLENVIPQPLKKNKTINQYYSYDYIKSYVEKFNNNENNELKISTSYYATADFSGQETSAFLTTYNCTAIKNIPKVIYKFNSDFYIPAIGELSMAMENVGYINSKLTEIGKKTIDLNKTFTSSTLYDQYTVWNFDMNYAKIGYSDIYEKNYILPFFRYEQKADDIEDLESDVVKNVYNEFNLFTDLPNEKKFQDYVFYNYETNSQSYRNYIYPMNDKVFVGMPYLNHNKKDKLRFYIIIPSIKANNPFYANLLKVRPTFEEELEIYGRDIIQDGGYRLDLKYIECIMYTFDNYLDIFEMKYRETFVMSSANYNAEYINNKNDIKFTFNNLGYFGGDYCIAVCFEVRYYRYGGSDFDIIFRRFYYYNNFNILISFPYTNKIKFKYDQYYTQDGLIVNSIHNSDLINRNYISLNNYKKNNNKLKYLLSEFSKEFEKSLLVSKSLPEFGEQENNQNPSNIQNAPSISQQNADYVEINGVKWARKNLGASTQKDAGYYIQWAANNNTHYCMENKIGNGKNFVINPSPYYNSNGYTKYYTEDHKIRLNQTEGDDIANKTLGSFWRIPTTTEFESLINADKEYTIIDGINGIIFYNSDHSDSIFLPVTNYAKDNDIYYPDNSSDYPSALNKYKNYGYYWSRNLYGNTTTNDVAYADCFNFKINREGASIDLTPSNTNVPRYYGLPIRAVYDENFIDDDGSVIVEPEIISDIRKLKFNLLFNSTAETYNSEYEDNNDYISDGYVNSSQMIYFIRTYLIDKTNSKSHGIFGELYEGNTDAGHEYNETNDITNAIVLNLTGAENSTFTNDIGFYPYGSQQDIIFVKNTAYKPFKKIRIYNNTGKHVNIWFEDELKRLCTKKTRLCIPPNYSFITYASKFLDSYYIKLNIELYNEYKFEQNGLPYYNIYVNTNYELTNSNDPGITLNIIKYD